jgi:hypothetical protein
LQHKEIIDSKRRTLAELETVAKSLKRETGEMREKLSRYIFYLPYQFVPKYSDAEIEEAVRQENEKVFKVFRFTSTFLW